MLFVVVPSRRASAISILCLVITLCVTFAVHDLRNEDALGWLSYPVYHVPAAVKVITFWTAYVLSIVLGFIIGIILWCLLIPLTFLLNIFHIICYVVGICVMVGMRSPIGYLTCCVGLIIAFAECYQAFGNQCPDSDWWLLQYYATFQIPPAQLVAHRTIYVLAHVIQLLLLVAYVALTYVFCVFVPFTLFYVAADAMISRWPCMKRTAGVISNALECCMGWTAEETVDDTEAQNASNREGAGQGEVVIRCCPLEAIRTTCNSTELWSLHATGLNGVNEVRQFFEARQGQSNRQAGAPLNILSIVKVENLRTLNQFEGSDSLLFNPFCYDSYPNMDTDTFVFHGCPEAFAANIQASGLLLSRAREDGMLGRGIYGALDPRKAVHYCHSYAPYVNKFLFICRFNLTDAAQHAGPNTQHPNSVFDEFCVYNERHVVVLWMLKVL